MLPIEQREAMARAAKRLHVYMTHTPRDAEFVSVLDYRVSQLIAKKEREIADLRELHECVKEYERDARNLIGL